MYVQLRHDLAKIFTFRGCADPEGLTDEVFDRVAKKVLEVRPTYVSDPRLYFRAVANNLIKERSEKAELKSLWKSLNCGSRQQPRVMKITPKTWKNVCVRVCKKLSAENRKLIVQLLRQRKAG